MGCLGIRRRKAIRTLATKSQIVLQCVYGCSLFRMRFGGADDTIQHD